MSNQKFRNMRPEDTKRLIAEADELLQDALEEMKRAEEDVSTYKVCHGSRKAILHYLEAFLRNNNVTIKVPTTINSLMEQCRDYDARFDLINVTPIDCKTHTGDSDYCLNVDKVGTCLRIAEQARDMALHEVPSY